ncbi:MULTISPECIES: AAA family ATPase [Pseudomonas]|uniref:AAA family ATPase n=1 Tax=Pseudomonas TaxID=286 RepID=UPI0004E735A8|nr:MULTISPECIES: AAA family ATPase [Pseudomonas]KFF47391.1 hypothetical protein JH25_27360 [Pseudomonas sp. BRG-100]MCK3832930.1 hypothetical protein [Pseudomonas fluorescens]MCK3865542.1 hypothetical protein [Pseudomonas sp. B329]
MPTLHLLCGKIASGKSTLAKTLAAEHAAIVLSEDHCCRARLHERNARGEHDFAATDAEFDLITRHFCVPSEEEGLVIKVHRP